MCVRHPAPRREPVGLHRCAEPYQPLGQDIADHAYAAAFEDPRFEPLQDLRGVHIEVSVLGPLVEFPATSYDDVVARLPREGAVVSAQGRRGTFLPTVWEQLPTSESFVAGLWRKAGLRPGTWPRRSGPLGGRIRPRRQVVVDAGQFLGEFPQSSSRGLVFGRRSASHSFGCAPGFEEILRPGTRRYARRAWWRRTTVAGPRIPPIGP